MNKFSLHVLFVLALIAMLGCQPRVSSTAPYVGSVRVDASDTDSIILLKAASLVPTERQLRALDDGFIGFVHFGPNTFSRREWGTGFEDPAIFDLHELHTDEWCADMKAAGMKMVILTVKHHDGFCLWQSRYTTHGIMSSPFQEGKGDILRELSQSCQKYGLRLGIYLSPADLYQIESPDGLYGNLSAKTLRTIPRPVEGRPFANPTTFQFTVDDYNEYFLNQLFELLTEYGPISEVWFDGAHPKRKGGQTYDYTAWRQLIRTLVPEATIFGREDIRWCGNESGDTREAEFNVITYDEDPSVMTEFFDIHGNPGSREAYLNRSKPFWLHYQPAETDVSIRAGWFYSDDDYQRVRSADNVFDMWERSVGGNSILLLNVPPNREGRFSGRDAAVLHEVGRRISATYDPECNLLAGAHGPRAVLDEDQSTMTDVTDGLTVTLRRPVTINRVLVREPVGTVGERIEQLVVEARIKGEWTTVGEATNVGNRRIVRFDAVETDGLRIRVLASRAKPFISTLQAFYYDAPAPEPSASDRFLPKQQWTIVQRGTDPVVGREAIDGDAVTTWETSLADHPSLTIDLGDTLTLRGFASSPAAFVREGIMSEGLVAVSLDGKAWAESETFHFGNLINDPTLRLHFFHTPVQARFIRIVPTATADDTPVVKMAELDLF